MIKPSIIADGHVLFVGSTFSGSAGGSSVVMRALTSQFSPESFSIISTKQWGNLQNPPEIEGRTLRIGISPKLRASRIGKLLGFLQLPFLVRKGVDFAERQKATVVVASFPSLNFFWLGMRIAEKAHIPLVVYLHDTLVESLPGRLHKIWARRVQKRIFATAKVIMVMSDGMAEMYKTKYGLETVVLRHIYNGPLPIEQESGIKVENRLFWSGNIYDINTAGIKRVVSAAESLNMPIMFSGKHAISDLRSKGLLTGKTSVRFFESMDEYYQAIKSSAVLLLTLVAPEETSVGYDELSTIFPTKTPEYLSSRRPILLHCPMTHYLARFFIEHKCGLVVSSTSPEAICESIKKLLSDKEYVDGIRRNALIALKLFYPNVVAECFQNVIGKAVECGHKRD